MSGAQGIVGVPPRTERTLTVPDLTAEALIDRLRRATIGRYDVYAELGSGGMAAVFLALDLALDRKVAIKVMSPALMSSSGAIDRFRREARVAAALSHPHIVPIHAVGEEPGIAYYVMKFVEGRSLDSVLHAEGRRDLDFAQSILGNVGSALQYAHQRGVVHRDVKPANIMLDREGWCYIADFGIAKTEDAAGITNSGVIIGTPNYMCPEQFNGLPITGAADQYALGVVAYEMLTGKPPYGGASVGEVMRGHLFDPVPAVRSVRADIDEATDRCVKRMMAKDAAARYASVADAVADFGTVTASAERRTRAVIAGLAERGASAQPSISVPTSPSPQLRSTLLADVVEAATRPMTPPAGVRPPSADSNVQRTRRSRVTLLLGLGAVVVVGVFTWRAVNQEPSTRDALAPPPAGATDSTREPTREPTRDSTAGATTSIAANAPLSAPVATPVRVAPAIPRPSPTQPASLGSAVVRIGSRIPLAVLYVNGVTRGVVGQTGIQAVPIAAGRVQISLRAENCQNWDTTFTAVASEAYVIGYRGPRC